MIYVSHEETVVFSPTPEDLCMYLDNSDLWQEYIHPKNPNMNGWQFFRKDDVGKEIIMPSYTIRERTTERFESICKIELAFIKESPALKIATIRKTSNHQKETNSINWIETAQKFLVDIDSKRPRECNKTFIEAVYQKDDSILWAVRKDGDSALTKPEFDNGKLHFLIEKDFRGEEKTHIRFNSKEEALEAYKLWKKQNNQ